jgi:hypothetical protein
VASTNLAEKRNIERRLQFRQVDGTDIFSEVNLRSAPNRTHNPGSNNTASYPRRPLGTYLALLLAGSELKLTL